MNCIQCGQLNADGSKFCSECGVRLSQTSSTNDGPRNLAYTPAHLAEKILKTRSALQGERKPVSVLFCDICDSTVLAERVGADRTHQVLNEFFEAALAQVHRYEGTVNQFLGDGFMALFGAPIAHEDHARRAVLAALAIRDAINGHESNFGGIELRLRMGLNSGSVVVGSIGDNLRMDYTAHGDTTNIAARLQGAAEPGVILVSEAIHRAAHANIEWRLVGPRLFKGKTEPVVVYEAVRARTVATDRVAVPGHEVLVGRRSEALALTAAAERLQAGTGGAISLIGEAGLGKSRLMEEARRLARERSLRWLQGDCLSFGRTLSYWSFREVIRRGLGIEENDNESQAWRKVESGMRALFAEQADEFLPYIGTLLAVALPEPLAQRVKALDNLAMGHQIFRATLLMCERSARQRPMIVAFEDWHWADASSAALLEHLLPLSNRVPILFVIASRPEPEGPAESLRTALSAQSDPPITNAQILTLMPLPAVDSMELVERLLGGGVPPVAVRDMLLRRSEGNPFYLGELVRTLIGTRAIERDSDTGEWQVTPQFAAVPLPDSIEGLILARIDRLEDEAKQVLKAAAVVGRTFFYRVLKAVMEAEAALDDDLTKLRRAELIDEKQLAPELEYVFKHPLIQQATYDSLLEERRREMHAQVGRCIEQLFAGRLDPFYSILAYHYAKAQEWTKGLEYLFKAAEHADRLAADEEALELYHAAIETAERHSVEGLGTFKRAQLEYKIGEAHFRAGRHLKAEAALNGALLRLGQRPPKARLLIGWGVLVGVVRHSLPTRAIVRAAVRQPQSPTEALCTDIRDLLGRMYFFIDAIQFAYNAFQLTRNPPQTRGHVLGLSHAGLALDGLYLYGAAKRAHAQARERSELHHQDSIQAIQLASLHEHQTGQWTIAIELARQCCDLAWSTGLIRLWAGSFACLMRYLYSCGDPEWIDMGEVAEKAANETADRQAYAWSVVLLAYGQEQRGAWDTALATLLRAGDLLAAIPDPRILAHALAIRTTILTRLGRLDEAHECIERAHEITRRSWLTGDFCTRTWTASAELRLAQFEAAPMTHRSATGRAAAKAVKAMLRQGQRVRDEGAVDCHRFAGTYEWLHGRRDRALACWAFGLAESHALGARQAQAQILAERGRRTDSKGDLDQAVVLYEQCGAIGELCALQTARAHQR